MQVMRITVMFGLIFLMAFSLNLFAQEQNTEKGFTPNWGDFKPYEKDKGKELITLEWKLNSMLELGDLPPARFLTVDPMADMYPHMTPYHYTLNNPMRYIDPTGMWVASYDSSGNIVNVTAEEGDNLEGLYSQLGITSEQFAEQYGISDMSKYSVVAGQTAFDITSHVVVNTNFDANFQGGNCHSFVCAATGKVIPETGTIAGNQLFSNLGNTTQANTPLSGNVSVWETQGSMNGVDLTGDPAHSAIFIVKNSAGEAQYLQRMGTNHPVGVSTGSNITSYYQKQIQKFQSQYNVKLPTMSPSLKFYRVR